MYYATGDEKRITELKIVLTINDPDAQDGSLNDLAITAGILTKRALKLDIPEQTLEAIISKRSGKWKVGKNEIALLHEPWSSGSGYEMKFIIR